LTVLLGKTKEERTELPGKKYHSTHGIGG